MKQNIWDDCIIYVGLSQGNFGQTVSFPFYEILIIWKIFPKTLCTNSLLHWCHLLHPEKPVASRKYIYLSRYSKCPFSTRSSVLDRFMQFCNKRGDETEYDFTEKETCKHDKGSHQYQTAWNWLALLYIVENLSSRPRPFFQSSKNVLWLQGPDMLRNRAQKRRDNLGRGRGVCQYTAWTLVHHERSGHWEWQLCQWFVHVYASFRSYLYQMLHISVLMGFMLAVAAHIESTCLIIVWLVWAMINIVIYFILWITLPFLVHNRRS